MWANGLAPALRCTRKIDELLTQDPSGCRSASVGTVTFHRVTAVRPMTPLLVPGEQANTGVAAAAGDVEIDL